MGFAERIEVVRAAIEASSVPVIAQVGCLTTVETLKTVLKCEELGVQAIAIVSPPVTSISVVRCLRSTLAR